MASFLSLSWPPEKSLECVFGAWTPLRQTPPPKPLRASFLRSLRVSRREPDFKGGKRGQTTGEKGPDHGKRGQTTNQALPLPHPLSNRGHCSPFHPFTLSPFQLFNRAAGAGAGAPFSTQRTQSEHKEHKVLPSPVFVFFASSTPLRSLRFPLALPLLSTCGESFFQSLENCRKIFPIIGKIGSFFPTIGKYFSNHWKTPVGAGR